MLVGCRRGAQGWMGMDKSKRDGGPVSTLAEEWTRVTSIAALDRLLRYAKDEASSLEQWAVAELLDTAITALPGSDAETPPDPAPRKREKPAR